MSVSFSGGTGLFLVQLTVVGLLFFMFAALFQVKI
jgi:hypothetical protein